MFAVIIPEIEIASPDQWEQSQLFKSRLEALLRFQSAITGLHFEPHEHIAFSMAYILKRVGTILWWRR